jgi:hypothetical protein
MATLVSTGILLCCVSLGLVSSVHTLSVQKACLILCLTFLHAGPRYVASGQTILIL